jgi:hypothetical protein
MKVRDLKKWLESLDPDLRIIMYTEDEEFVREGHIFTLFDATGIDVTNAELTRIDEAPSLKFGATDASVKIAVIEMTSMF